MKLNIGSGQRRFGDGWVNLDVVSRPPDQVPDVLRRDVRVFLVHAKNLKTLVFVRLVCAFKKGHLSETRAAPSAPEIDNQVLASIVRQASL